MIELIEQNPYVDKNDICIFNLVKHYAEDEYENRYYIRQVETGIEYSEAVDVLPCRYTYVATDKMIEKENEIE